jgi:hypothetical protein
MLPGVAAAEAGPEGQGTDIAPTAAEATVPETEKGAGKKDAWSTVSSALEGRGYSFRESDDPGALKYGGVSFPTFEKGPVKIAFSRTALSERGGEVFHQDVPLPPDHINLDAITVDPGQRGSGKARDAFTELLGVLDAEGITATLEPAPIRSLSGKKLSKQQLIEWYKRHGFEQRRKGSDLILERKPSPSAKDVAVAPEPEAQLEKAKPKLTEMFAGPPLKLGGINLGKIKAKVKDWLIRGTITHAPKKARLSLERAKGFSEAEMSEVGERARALRKAVSKMHGKAWQDQPIAKQLDAAFEDPAKMAALPQELQRPLALMRAHLDQMIREQVRTGVVDPTTNLAQIILGSEGKYSKREYRAFNDVKWADKVEPEVRQRFADMLVKEGKTAEDAKGITEAILQEAKEAAGNPFQQIASSKLGRKNLSIYKARKVVPPELRALLGEIEDPLANYANSVTRIANVIARHKAYTEIRRSGLDGGWLSDSKKRAPGHSATISSEGNPALGPLDGMHTTPEIKAALVEVDSATMAKYLRPVMAVNAAIKWGKVLGQPTAFARNLLSNVTLSIANGHMPLWFKGEAWKHAFQGGSLAERKRLIELGIIGEGVNTVEWDDYRSSLKQTPEEMAKAQHGLLTSTKRGIEKLYSAADNLPKIVGFYAEEAALIDAGLSAKEAESLAADRIRNLYPTTGRMVAALKHWRQQPGLGKYFSFRAELFRTFFHRARLIKQELGSNNPKIRAMGLRRVFGTVVAHSATPAAAHVWRMLQGVDEEEDRDAREFVPEYDQDHELIRVGSGTKGQYVDVSDIDPTTMFTDPIMRIVAGEDVDKVILRWLDDQRESFFGLSPISRLAVDYLSGETKEGRPIDDMTEHVLKEIQPGFVAWYRKASKDGFGADDVASFAVARTYDYDVEKSIGKEISNYVRLISESSQRASRRIGRGKEEETARTDQEGERKQAFDDLSRKVGAAMRLGLPTKTVERMLDAQLSSEQTAALLTGSYLPYEPPKKKRRNL